MNFKQRCPICGELADIRIVKALGMCLGCDHVRVEADALEGEAEEMYLEAKKARESFEHSEEIWGWRPQDF